MIIASIPLQYHLRPSILSLSRWIDSERFILFSDDMNIHVIKWNPFIPEVCSIDTLNALSYDMAEDGSIAAALYPNYLSIQHNGTSLSIRLTSEVSKLSLFKYDKSNYCVFLYGSTTVETYYILENGTVVTSPPIYLSSKCELVSYSHGILFTVLIDGSLSFWSLDPNDKWNQMGSELFNTYRITDICCSNFPEIVITTWEGTIYLKLYSQHSVQGSLKPIATIEPRSEIQPGECCGTFVKFNAQSKLYVISRAVSNEIIVYNHSFDTSLLSIHLPTFFRGLLISPSDTIPMVIGLTNDSIYAFHLPPILYLQKSPISVESITNVVTKNLPWLYLQGFSDRSLSSFEILNHCIRFGDQDKKVFYFSKRLLDVLLLNDNFVLIGFSDCIVIVDMNSQTVVQQLVLSVPSIREMRFCMCDCNNVCVFVSHVLSDSSVMISTSSIQFESKNDTISILQSPHFSVLPHDSRKSLPSACNIPVLFGLIVCSSNTL